MTSAANHRSLWRSSEWCVFTSQRSYVGHVENDGSAGCLLTQCCRLYIVTGTQQKNGSLPFLAFCFITPKDKSLSGAKTDRQSGKQPMCPFLQVQVLSRKAQLSEVWGFTLHTLKYEARQHTRRGRRIQQHAKSQTPSPYLWIKEQELHMGLVCYWQAPLIWFNDKVTVISSWAACQSYIYNALRCAWVLQKCTNLGKRVLLLS